jgi:hypothetical protein
LIRGSLQWIEKLTRGEFTSKILKSAPRIRTEIAQLHRIFPLLMILHDSRIDRFDAKILASQIPLIRVTAKIAAICLQPTL